MSSVSVSWRCMLFLGCLVYALCIYKVNGSLTLCPDRWVAFRGSCYLFGHENPLKFVEAEHYCRQHGGHLVHVDNATEDAFLRDFSKALKNSYWLGITDETVEGVWDWYDTDTALTFTSGWTPGAPDDYGGVEDCAVYSTGHNFYWNDVSCGTTAEPLCETRDAEVRPVVG